MSQFKANLYYYKTILDDSDRKYMGQLVYDSEDAPRAFFNIARDLSVDTIEEFDPKLCGEMAIMVPIGVIYEVTKECRSIQDCRNYIRSFVNNYRFEVIIDEE